MYSGGRVKKARASRVNWRASDIVGGCIGEIEDDALGFADYLNQRLRLVGHCSTVVAPNDALS